jgi:alkyl hydroperoxide reductase subunit F
VAILRPEEEAKVRELFAALERPVELFVALGPEETPLPGARDLDFGAEATRLAEGLAALSERVRCTVHEEPAGFPRFPSISIRPEGRDAGIRYDGLPWGYELGSLIGGVLEAGKREPTLKPESREALAALDRDLALDVFVTPT